MADRTCSVEGCDRPYNSRDLCTMHYSRLRRAGSVELQPRKPRPPAPPRSPCVAPECDRVSKSRGLCTKHYQRARSQGLLPTVQHHRPHGTRPTDCGVADCERPVVAQLFCELHYRREIRALRASRRHGERPGWRRCRHCRELKPVTEFGSRSDSPNESFRPHCKPCVARQWQDRRDANLAKKAMRNYGITAEEYKAAMAAGCAVCGQQSSQSGRRLHIDHCHVTGKFRGVLCHSCNTALGLAADSPERLRQLAAYLDRHRAARHLPGGAHGFR